MAKKPTIKWITQAQIRNIAKSSNALAVTTAFSQLGPINVYEDLLDTSGSTKGAICLAAEQVVHMAECWRYLSSAMYAFLNHEVGNAVHLAYYAELRAALSLFSGAGIRIKQRDAYWLNDESAVIVIPSHKTHDLVWKLWNEWIKRPDAGALIENNIRIEAGVALKDFQTQLMQFSPGVLLGQWGYDLVKLKDDHLARNQASYIAYWRDKPLSRMSADQLVFVKMLSELFLSSGSGLIFDQALIQYAVHQTVEGSLDHMNPENHTIERQQKLDNIAEFVARQSGVDKAHLLRNLSANIGESIFEKAKQRNDEAENVLSRAAFLARLAMLSVNHNIISAENDHAKKWLRNWLEHCGAWQPTLGGSVGDIEADLSDALDVFPTSTPVIPADLWNNENAFITSKIANLHACIAWGAAA
jgi:hypothetical protein